MKITLYALLSAMMVLSQAVIDPAHPRCGLQNVNPRIAA
jgi:hypothetical protein